MKQAILLICLLSSVAMGTDYYCDAAATGVWAHASGVAVIADANLAALNSTAILVDTAAMDEASEWTTLGAGIGSGGGIGRYSNLDSFMRPGPFIRPTTFISTKPRRIKEMF